MKTLHHYLIKWRYKDTDKRHIGPLAEDFVAAFDVGTIREQDGQREDHYLAAGDFAGIALRNVQQQTLENQKLQQWIEDLESPIQILVTNIENIKGAEEELAQNSQ